MNNNNNHLGDNTAVKKKLRILGFILIICGGLMSLIGLIDFFAAFGSFEPPKLFFLLFLGFPMTASGAALLFYSYMGKIARFTSQEITPVVKDTANYIIDGTKDTFKGAFDTVRGKTVKCFSCGAINTNEANFCKECGKPLNKTCSYCNSNNDSNSKFCNKCGKELI